MTGHGDRAREYFYKGYNCAQAVVCAFGDLTGWDEKTSARRASSFGGGMGRLREVCGAFSGAILVLGEITGYSEPEDHEGKKTQYKRIQVYAERFRERQKTIICRELMADVKAMPGGEPEERTPEFYASRPCPQIIWDAADLLDELLTELQEGQKES